MRTLSLIVHVSLDGYVALPSGDLSAFPTGEENLSFVAALCKVADTILMGRRTYELLQSYWPDAGTQPRASEGTRAYSVWYNQVGKVVVSKSLSGQNVPNTIIIDREVIHQVSTLKSKAGKDIFLFGSPTLANCLLKAGLIDRIWYFINPVLFGMGIPLFSEFREKSYWKLESQNLFPNHELALCYSRVTR